MDDNKKYPTLNLRNSRNLREQKITPAKQM